MHEHELQLSGVFWPNICISGIIYNFFILTKQNCKYIFFYQIFVHLGKNSSIYCNLIIIVHVHATFFSKVHPACQNIANSKKTDKHAVDCSKAVCWGIK